MAAQNFKEEDWGNGDTKLGQNWHKNFQACREISARKITDAIAAGYCFSACFLAEPLLSFLFLYPRKTFLRSQIS